MLPARRSPDIIPRRSAAHAHHEAEMFHPFNQAATLVLWLALAALVWMTLVFCGLMS